MFHRLEQETGVSTGWKQCGFIELASTRDYLHQFRRIAAFNRRHGVDVHEISPKEILDLFPMCRVDDVLAGFYVKEDGRANPVDATMSLVKGAKMLGTRFYEGFRVDTVLTRNGGVSGVRLENGHVIECEFVLNCAGMWARQLGAKNGVAIGNQAAEHYYLITEPIAGVDPNWPVIEDPDCYTYIRSLVSFYILVYCIFFIL